MSNGVGNIKDLNTSRGLALQGLLSSLGHATSDPSSGAKLSPEQLRNLSNKIDQILGDGADQNQTQQFERGQLLNEEGLPIVDISEPISQDPKTSATSTTAPEPDFIPIPLLPLTERERRRRERDRVLSLLEEEERLQQLQDERDAEQERKEAMRKRKESVKAELEQLKAAKELQKKMGKALIRNITEAREKEENVIKEEAISKLQPASSTPKKSVTFADAPDDDREKKSSKHQVDWGDVATGRLRSSGRIPILGTAEIETYPMKMHVVERLPKATPPPIFQNSADSDDESPVPSEHSSPRMENATPDEDEEDPRFEQVSSSNEESSDEEPLEEEFNWDSAQHHREIALEYYKKRHAIGAETAKTMATRSHDDEHEEPQLMGRQLSGKSPLSCFQADRMAGTYDKSRAPVSTSIGPSVIPASRQKSLRNSIRVCKLENDQLIGGGSGESGSEDETVKEVLRMLKNGSIQNAGPDFDPSLLTSNIVSPTPTVEGLPPTETSLLLPAPAHTTKPSRFKSAHAGRTVEISPTQDAPSTGISRPNPAVSGVVERKNPRLSPSPHFPLNKPARRFPTEIKPSDAPMTSSIPDIVTPSSFPAPSMIIDSPSFPRVQPTTPKEGVRASSRPQRPPVVMSSTVKESSRQCQSNEASAQATSKQYVSRFMAERR
ncbi:hypothetical protein BS17DRAFT_774383 [Gyrodon lividus]|nr:hypothetical protein BS17DRAFT_774383 [Gyrodon lividus]